MFSPHCVTYITFTNPEHTMDTPRLIVTKDTLVSDILKEYGDIAALMEVFGVKRAGGLAVRKVLGRLLTVERAAIVHRVPLDEFLPMVQQAVGQGPDTADA
ncbi:MAG: hypothetical protein ACI8S6_000219 [Myxococcota bacterium]|jgi:hypothetical protein